MSSSTAHQWRFFAPCNASDSVEMDGRSKSPLRMYLRKIRCALTEKVSVLREKASLALLFRWGVFAAICTFLLYQLSRIGWAEILAALPTSPVFYALPIGFVLAPVCAEIFSFQTISGQKAWRHRKLFLRKHVLNKAVVNYSGDAFFVQRVAKMKDVVSTPLGLRRAAIIMKDMTLLRAFVANGWILILAIVAIVFGDYSVLQKIASVSPVVGWAVGALTLGVCFGGVLLFPRLTRLSFGTAGKVASIYLLRSVIVAGILIAQWSLAVPGHMFTDWFIFLILFSITKKSPVGGELVFASVVVTLPGLTHDAAAVAAMLIALAAVAQVLYFIGFVITQKSSKQQR